MIKRYKWKLIISSVITLLPVLFGLFADKILPERIATHFALDGTPDGFMAPTTFFIMMPLILLAIHWLCVGVTAIIDKNNEQSAKVTGIMFFIMPVMSLFTCAMVFAIALGYTANIYSSILVLLAVMFIVIGNYLPKTTRNKTTGIKIKWTLSSDENWRATHRFGGKVYFATGILCLLGIFLPERAFPVFVIAIILASVVLPTIYSYRFYKKQLAQGELTKEEADAQLASVFKHSKAATVVAVVISVIILALVCWLMFTGDIHISLGDNAVTVDASFWDDVSISYSDIDSVEYVENGVDGSRIYGFGSARLLLGSFKNDELGTYTRFTYTGDKPCIVLTLDENIIVLGTDNEQTTLEIYETLAEKIK